MTKKIKKEKGTFILQLIGRKPEEFDSGSKMLSYYERINPVKCKEDLAGYDKYTRDRNRGFRLPNVDLSEKKLQELKRNYSKLSNVSSEDILLQSEAYKTGFASAQDANATNPYNPEKISERLNFTEWKMGRKHGRNELRRQIS